MKIKLLKTPRPGQTDMVFQTKLGTYAIELGKSMHLTADEAADIMKQWPGCFSQEDLSKMEEPAKSVDKVAEKAAAEEATKMLKEYKNKKLNTEG